MSSLETNPDGSIDVPDSTVPLHVIWEFALSYNAYERHGDIADNANQVSTTYVGDGVLPDDLATLRSALFFEQRRAHHFGEYGPREAPVYVIALLDKIRELSGGSVAGPGDAWP